MSSDRRKRGGGGVERVRSKTKRTLDGGRRGGGGAEEGEGRFSDSVRKQTLAKTQFFFFYETTVAASQHKSSLEFHAAIYK